MEATPLTATDTATIRRFIELDMADGEWWARMGQYGIGEYRITPNDDNTYTVEIRVNTNPDSVVPGMVTLASDPIWSTTLHTFNG